MTEFNLLDSLEAGCDRLAELLRLRRSLLETEELPIPDEMVDWFEASIANLATVLRDVLIDQVPLPRGGLQPGDALGEEG